jgi:enoyl-CoA hydratase/carnithine racemase
MDFTFLIVSQDGPVTTIVLNRPEVMNAIHTPMHFEMQAALDAFDADPAQRVCVIRGAGERAFCAGSDLKYSATMRAAGRHDEIIYPTCGYAGLIERFDLTKPLIAAVNGIAAGGGFEIVLACDLAIATANARFGLPEPLVGQVATGGGMHRLVRQIGFKPAMGMILASRMVDAEEGQRLGFINEVVPPKELDSVVASWVDAVLRGAPAAVRAAKQSVYRGLDQAPLADAIDSQERCDAVIAWRASDDKIEGIRAFAEKRPPRWTAC